MDSAGQDQGNAQPAGAPTGPGFGPPPAKPSVQPHQAGQANALMPGLFSPGNPANGVPSREVGFGGGGGPGGGVPRPRNPLASAVAPQQPGAAAPPPGYAGTAQMPTPPGAGAPNILANAVAPPGAPDMAAQERMPGAPPPMAESAGMPGKSAAVAESGAGQYEHVRGDDALWQKVQSAPEAQRADILKKAGYTQDANGKWQPPTAPGGAGDSTAVDTAKGGVSTFDPANQQTWYDDTGNPTWKNADIKADPRTQQQQFLKPIPNNWDAMSPAEQRSWKQDNYNPYPSDTAYLQNAPDQQAIDVATNLFKGTNLDVSKLPLPAHAGALPPPGTVIPPTASLNDFRQGGQFYVENPQIQSVLDSMGNQADNLWAMQQDQNSYGSDAYQHALHNYEASKALLDNLYGLKFDPLSGKKPAAGPGDLGIPDNTDLSGSQFPSVDQIPAELIRYFNSEPDGKRLALEFFTNQQLYNDAVQRQQQGVNLLQPVVDSTLRENNSLRRGSEDLAQGWLDNPDPVDWQGIRNRLGSDYDSNYNQQIQDLSTGAARRGVSPGGVQGISAQIGAGNRNALSRALGELTTQEQMGRRDAEFAAVNNAGGVSRNYQGAESLARQLLANAVMGTPQAAQNPYSGITNTLFGSRAIGMQQQGLDDQKDAQGNALLSGGIQGLGSILGAFAGNPALGSMFGRAGAQAVK